MDRQTTIKRVLSKIEAQKIYEREEIQSLINKGIKKFPKYNTDKKDSKKLVDFVMSEISPELRSKELEDKIISGIT